MDKLIATIDGQIRNPKRDRSTVKVDGGTTGNAGQYKTVLLKIADEGVTAANGLALAGENAAIRLDKAGADVLIAAIKAAFQ